MTSITIVLAVLLLAAATIAGTALHRYKAQCRRIKKMMAALEDTAPTYCVKYLMDGRPVVVRVSSAMGCINQSVVKVFEDEDDKFNVLCAKELCEHLNEK